MFAKAAISGVPDQAGWIDGHPGQILIQIEAMAWTIGWCAIATFVILILIEKTIGLRVSEEVEREGLDAALHGERLR